jgi:hypothetical protein
MGDGENSLVPHSFLQSSWSYGECYGKDDVFLLLKCEREIFQGGLGHDGFFWGGCLACFLTCK